MKGHGKELEVEKEHINDRKGMKTINLVREVVLAGGGRVGESENSDLLQK